MIIRALDANGDWTYGAGRNNYKRGIDACAQDIKTRCLEVLGDCFFATDQGIDWFNLLGGREPDTSIAIDWALRARIVNTQNVTGITDSSSDLDSQGILNPVYYAQTAFSSGNGQAAVTQISTNDLLTEIGDLLTTEDGTGIGV